MLFYTGTKIYDEIISLTNNAIISTRFENLSFIKVNLNQEIISALHPTKLNLFKYDLSSNFFCYYDYILDVYLPNTTMVNEDYFDHKKNALSCAAQKLMGIIEKHGKVFIKVRNRTPDNNSIDYNKFLLFFLGSLVENARTKKLHMVQEANVRFKYKINIFAKYSLGELYIIFKALKKIDPIGFSSELLNLKLNINGLPANDEYKQLILKEFCSE